MTRTKVVALLAVVVLMLGACAAGPSSLTGTADADGDVAGFWDGLWHGIIAPITFIVSLFTDNVTPYDVNNTGGWYNFGFLLGAGVSLGGSGGGAASRRRRRD